MSNHNDLLERLNAAKERSQSLPPAEPEKERTWSAGIPFYITRPAADGRIATFEMPMWATLLITLLIMFNMIGWGIYGLVELVSKMVG